MTIRPRRLPRRLGRFFCAGHGSEKTLTADIVQASPVQLHTIPTWLGELLLEVTGTEPAYGAPADYHVALWHALEENEFDGDDAAGKETVWLRHWGTAIVDEREVFVSELWRITSATMQDIEWFAQYVGCAFYISGQSWWKPGRTVRVVLHECDENDEGQRNENHNPQTHDEAADPAADVVRQIGNQD